jgi:hypothetical protein
MKFTVRTPRPRNPLVAAARIRKAGSHAISNKSRRLASRHALRQELATAALHSPP